MKECFKCGVGEDKTFLYEGISKGGIIHVCRKCFHKSDIPIINKKDLPKDLDPGKRESVRDRLMQMAGLKDDKFHVEREMRKLVEKKEDVTLNDLVEKNFKKNLPEKALNHGDIVENFHWVLMRKRRSMKLTQEQVAKELFEPVAAIEAAERGILPKDYLGLIKKFENYYDIVLFKTSKPHFTPEKLAGESKISTGITIRDLRKINSRRERISKEDEEFEPADLDLKKVEEVVGKPVEDKKSKRANGISQEELDNILFGKKR